MSDEWKIDYETLSKQIEEEMKWEFEQMMLENVQDCKVRTLT